jgi:hypothetical protein
LVHHFFNSIRSAILIIAKKMRHDKSFSKNYWKIILFFQENFQKILLYCHIPAMIVVVKTGSRLFENKKY